MRMFPRIVSALARCSARRFGQDQSLVPDHLRLLGQAQDLAIGHRVGRQRLPTRIHRRVDLWRLHGSRHLADLRSVGNSISLGGGALGGGHSLRPGGLACPAWAGFFCLPLCQGFGGVLRLRSWFPWRPGRFSASLQPGGPQEGCASGASSPFCCSSSLRSICWRASSALRGSWFSSRLCSASRFASSILSCMLRARFAYVLRVLVIGRGALDHLHALVARGLLHDVRNLVSQQPRIHGRFPRPQPYILPMREGACLERVRRLVGCRVGVNTHPIQIGPQA